ncbi:MAG: aldehyde dehydrogenase family protein [Lentisphaeria bacterium]|nr:aldehyde dehydrogenase family protein [Lentisphaeria bacterium]
MKKPVERIPVQKTYKLYIGGAFPRTESGRFYRVEDGRGKLLANMCQASRKDLRNAVVAARKAFSDWAGRSAYNRGQILYRVAEILETRRDQFIAELKSQGLPIAAARGEVDQSIEQLVYYAGWADKYQQLFSTVNPVSSSHFNFSILEPTGVVGILAPAAPSLLGIVATMAPVVCGGNSCVVLASETRPLCSITLAEVLETSDFPAGVVNILTGSRRELLEQFATHMDINAIVYCGDDAAELRVVQEGASLNVKRLVHCTDTAASDPYRILEAQEVKTTWHPIGA